MAAKIVKTERVTVPPLRLIGRRYTEADRQDSSFSHKWGEWFSTGLFDPLEAVAPPPEGFFDGAYIGAMTLCRGEFEYWIGMFLPQGTEVPEGYDCVDLEGYECAILWLYGNPDNGEIYGMDAMKLCGDAIAEQGWKESGGWFFERYNCPRFTTPDEAGNVILDYGIPLIPDASH